MKVISKTTRRRTRKVYVTVTDPHARRSRGLTIEGVTLGQAFAAITALSIGTDSTGAHGRATEKH